MNHKFIKYLIILMLTVTSGLSFAKSRVDAQEIVYEEKEQGTDFFDVRYTISDDTMRIDDDVNSGEEVTGYIIFNFKTNTIYSVSHFDRSILRIPKFEFDQPEFGHRIKLDYSRLEGSPPIDGKDVYSYRLDIDLGNETETCMHIQVAEGLMMGVAQKLKQYQHVVSGQLVRNIKSTPEEYRTPCFMIDQVYNDGAYYEKGLPVHEWHSNDKTKTLKSMKNVQVAKEFFDLPEGYRQISLDEILKN